MIEKLDDLLVYFWDDRPSIEDLLADMFENNINISFEMGGQTSWWAIVRDTKRKAIIPVQTGKTPEEVVKKSWLELNKKMKWAKKNQNI